MVKVISFLFRAKMDDCFQVKEENIEYKEVKENFHAISGNNTEIEIKEEPLENNEFKDTKDNFLKKAANDTDIEIKEEPLETIVENYVGVSEIKPEQSEEYCNIYDPLNVTSVHEEKKLLKCDVGSKMRNGNRQARCFCKVYLSCTNTITNPLDFLSIHQKEKLTALEYKLRCIICSMKFANRAQLEEHARSVHEKLKPFKCTICDTKFAQKSGLLLHNRTIHEKKKTFKCTICHSEFTCRDFLEKHTGAVHEKIKPFKCTLCNSKFASKQYLERHTIAVHFLDEAKTPKDQNYILETQAPFIPENKAMKRQRKQQISERTTFEEKKEELIKLKLKCDFCSAIFFNKKIMNRHVTLQLHCKLCKKDFQSKRNLNVHVASVHQGMKPFECSICNSRFSLKQNMVTHIASVHKVNKTL